MSAIPTTAGSRPDSHPGQPRYEEIPIPPFRDICARRFRYCQERGCRLDCVGTLAFRNQFLARYKEAEIVHRFLSASGLTALLDRYLPMDKWTDEHPYIMRAFSEGLGHFQRYLELRERYITASAHVHQELSLADFVHQVTRQILPTLGTDKFDHAVESLGQRLDLLQWESGDGVLGKKDRIQDLERRLTIEAERAGHERKRREAIEGKLNNLKGAAKRLLEMAESTVNAVDAEIAEVQNCGLADFLVDEEVARLGCHRKACLTDVVQLREILNSLEQAQ